MDSEINPRVLNLITRQCFKLQQSPPDGVTPVINEENILDIQADIKGPETTPYEGGIFRCKLELPNDFPNAPPKGYLLTKIFHPNISVNGEICVNTLKKDWNPVNWSLPHIFQVIRCLLMEPFPESSLNEEAGRMFMEDYELYCRHARIFTSIHAMPKATSNELQRKVHREVEQLKKWLKRV